MSPRPGPPAGAGVRVERVADAAAVLAAADLFDGPPLPGATARFLAEPGHHLLLAYAVDGPAAGRPVGMVSGMEITHPDKGTEVLLYELGVDEGHRRRGVATALVRALAALAAERGCTGMWVPVDADNAAARALYRAAGATGEEDCVVQTWDLAGGREGRAGEQEAGG